MGAPPLTLDSLTSPTRVRYVVLVWLCAAATIAYIHRNSIAVAEEDVRQSLCLTKEQMGVAMSAFFVSYAVFQVPAGWLSHIWGTRLALPLFAILWSLMTGLSGLAVGLAGLVAARLGMGIAQAGIFSCTTNTVAQWFPATGRALPSGFLGSFMSVGGALGAVLTGLLLEAMDWRLLFVVLAMPGFLWAVWFVAWFHERPQEHPSVNARELALLDGFVGKRQGHGPEPTPWRLLFTSPAMLWICCQQFFRAGAYMFFGSWFPTFLRETYGVTSAEAGFLTGLPLLGVVVGSPAGGAVSDWILTRTGSRRLSRQWLSIVSLAASAVLVWLAIPIASAVLAVLVITAAALCAAIAAPCAYAITIDMGGKHVAPVFSLMNMSGNLGAMVFPVVVPPLLAVAGNWNLVVFVFGGIYLVAALCWLRLNPSGTVFDRPGHENAEV
jgi:ACS family glucarate transporter-like MFS transporter